MALLRSFSTLLPPKLQLLCGAPFTATTHPLSAHNAPLVHTGHQTHDGVEGINGGLEAGSVDRCAFAAHADPGMHSV
jgi:hypothetical protein